MVHHSQDTDQRLTEDTHPLFQWRSSGVCLHHNASVPWIIIIPQTDALEFHDLNQQEQLEIMAMTRVIDRYFTVNFGTEKINFAAIGNVVQQLHIHVIGRHHKDPLWPDVVWGNDLPNKTYTPEKVEQIRSDLHHLLKASRC